MKINDTEFVIFLSCFHFHLYVTWIVNQSITDLTETLFFQNLINAPFVDNDYTSAKKTTNPNDEPTAGTGIIIVDEIRP